MTAWVSCYQYRKWKGKRKETQFRLHALEPSWIDDADLVRGGIWSSSIEVFICAEKALKFLGETAPEPGELLEIEINPTTTWVME